MTTYTIDFIISLIIGAILLALALGGAYFLHEKLQEIKPVSERVVKVTL